MALAAVVWIGWREGQIELDLFLSPSRWWLDIPLGVVVGGGLAGGWELTRSRLEVARRLEESLRALLGRVRRDEVLGLALLSGFSEELFFRGAVQGSWGFVPATLLFAALHTGRGREYRVWTAAALLSGLALGGLVLWRHSLLAAMIAHFVVNAVGLERLRERED